MTAEDRDDDESLVADIETFLGATQGVVDNALPDDVEASISRTFDRLDSPIFWSEARAWRMAQLTHVQDGLLAAYYHRDRIETVERQIIQSLRDAYPKAPKRGGTASTRMPVISHEYIAYLLAARRTLDYLARGVSACFGRDVRRIKRLGTGLGDAKPVDVAARVRAECDAVASRFPDLLTNDKGRESERDTAAHTAPVEPASVRVVFFSDGRVGIEFQDGGRGHLPPLKTLDPERMATDELHLTASVDGRLKDVTAFCIDLMHLAVEAELSRAQDS